VIFEGVVLRMTSSGEAAEDRADPIAIDLEGPLYGVPRLPAPPLPRDHRPLQKLSDPTRPRSSTRVVRRSGALTEASVRAGGAQGVEATPSIDAGLWYMRR